MELDSRVKVFRGDSFRPRLSVDDIVLGYGLKINVSSSNELLVDYVDGVNYIESALVFLDTPIVVPNMTYLYSSKLWSLNKIGRGLLYRLVMDLCFLNPSISGVGVGKMTSWIVSYYVRTDKEGLPVLRYEVLFPIVSSYVEDIVNIDIVESDRVILYKANSQLTSNDKRYYSRFYRNKRIGGLYGELIHASAILACETVDILKRVTKTDVINISKDIKTFNRFNRHVEDRTVRLLSDTNNDRFFITEKTVENFYLFMEANSDLTSLELSKSLGLSFSTITKFRKIVKEIKQ